MLVLIRGSGDLASGIALRLKHAGIDVVMTDLERPTAIRRTVCFSTALTQGRFAVEDVSAVRVQVGDVAETLERGEIPKEMVVDDAFDLARAFGCKVSELFK